MRKNILLIIMFIFCLSACQSMPIRPTATIMMGT